MPADIDVLVSRGSPISFASNYLQNTNYNESSSSILNSETSRHSPLHFATALASSSYLSQSPPQFSSSPPTHFTFHGRCSSPTLVPVPSTLARSFGNLRLSTTNTMPVAVPRRPCLVVRCDEALSHKNKKRVVFADDRGFSLTQVRTMTEPSNMPPRWSFQFLAKVTQGAIVEVAAAAAEPWVVTFHQPASDYLDFRRRLDTSNVSLENVIVKEAEDCVIGTLKVRNLAFHKEVFVRTTTDHWKTHEDAYCTYVANSPATHGVTVLYDTFSFRLTLPLKSNKLEFCVCYRCEGTEFWDNNSGKNYIILKKTSEPPALKSENRILGHLERPLDTKICIAGKFLDGKSIQIDTWSEFASWNHLNNDTPYW